jgi:predicted PurR-regulated permease PerM
VTEARGESKAFLYGMAGALTLVLAWVLREIVILLGFALLVAYVLDPLVTALERLRLPRRRRIPRAPASAIVIVALLAALGWALAFAVPRFANEVAGFVERVPAAADRLLSEARVWAISRGFGAAVDPTIDSLKANASTLVKDAVVGITRWIGRLFSGIGQVVGFAVLPLLAFYLLAEREAVRASAVQFVPEAAHGRINAIGEAVDRALKSYVRGQAIVCLIMGLTVGVVLALLGFPLVLLLAVVVAVAEVVPILGAVGASVVIGIAGYTESPTLALVGMLVYLVINNVIAWFVTPRVMSRHLKMHPFVILVSVLAGGKLLGPAGVMLALPGAAVVQSLIGSFGPRRRRTGR